MKGIAVFTTGQVANICHVAPRTVSKWIDAGTLKGYRIPGSNDRRVPRDQLVKFLREHDFPLNGMEETLCLMVFTTDETLIRAVKAVAGDKVVHEARNWFTAGSVCRERCDAALFLLVDGGMGRDAALASIRTARECSTKLTILAVATDDDASTQDYVMAGADSVVRRSDDVAAEMEAML